MQSFNRSLSENESVIGRPGFRLDRLELWNWGTFHGEAQVLEPLGGWALLVGDNGSGKSTAIDALRTLLVPPRILNYNDASGDGRKSSGRDRTRRSYIRGAWASSSTIDSTAPTTQYLRDPGILSAIAAVFCDAPREDSATLAQILWEHGDEVRELFAISRGHRGLKDLLAGFSNTLEIKRAAKLAGWEVFESFAAYSERMRGLLHIPGDKALEVFNRAIGMKEVGDIDAFVRQYMLPSSDTFSFIRDTVQPHYRALLDCWIAIERAERQISLLRPVRDYAERIAGSESRISKWKFLQELVRPYIATLHVGLLNAQLSELGNARGLAEASRADAADRLSRHRQERDTLNAAINATDVGPRLQAITRELEYAEGARQLAQSRRTRIQPFAMLLECMSSLNDRTTFINSRLSWEQIERDETASTSRLEEIRAASRHRQELALSEMLDGQEELTSVEQNRVNIPREFLAIRLRLAESLDVLPEQFPFAGELMEVRGAYAEWTGAIERLLRTFGLSLLVPEHLYRPAAGYINSTNLHLRLNFQPVPSRQLGAPTLSNDRVPGRMEFKSEHPLHLWVAQELVRSFNHKCCMSVVELEQTDRGLTREGLFRNGTKHVKDDRKRIDDPTDRILGWSTERKIAALRLRISEAQQRAAVEGQSAEEARQAILTAKSRTAAAHELLSVTDFAEIFPTVWSERLISLRSEKALLEQSSKELLELQSRLSQIDTEISAREADIRKIDGDLGRLDDRLVNCRRTLEARVRQLAAYPNYEHGAAVADFEDIVHALPIITLENPDQLIQSASQSLQGKISYEQGKINEATEKMVASMSEFLNQFPDFKQVLSVGRAYVESFDAALKRIEDEDLPQHRERFEHYLNENLVGDLLMLNRRLEEHQEAIQARVEEINSALSGIDYSEETYVQLHLVSRPGSHVTEFKRSLKDCFEYGIAPAAAERLQIFDRVRLLLEQFQRDPEGTQRVTDVRSWYVSGVKELRQENNSEVNFYAATTGKSGGQKAKLAFTILASALAAQYGLSPASTDAANFRLVVIDEVFSRTDEMNSTLAMQLFESLGFQLIIVGPFDAKAKLAVPFVRSIHLVSNPDGNSSRLIAITTERLDSLEQEDFTLGPPHVEADYRVAEGA
jgi:uncharacterized protein YPO0396